MMRKLQNRQEMQSQKLQEITVLTHHYSRNCLIIIRWILSYAVPWKITFYSVMLFGVLPTSIKSLQVAVLLNVWGWTVAQLRTSLLSAHVEQVFFIWHSQRDIQLLLSLIVSKLTSQAHILHSQTVTLIPWLNTKSQKWYYYWYVPTPGCGSQRWNVTNYAVN